MHSLGPARFRRALVASVLVASGSVLIALVAPGPSPTSALRVVGAAPPAPVAPSGSGGGNLRMNQDRGPGLQLETAVAIHPHDPNRVIAVAMDIVAAQQVGYYVTADGGRSIAATGTFPLDPGVLAAGDPSVGFDAQGVAYVIDMQFQPPGGHLYVHKSTDGGLTWPQRILMWRGAQDHFPDKPYMAIDQRTAGPFAGSIYVSFTGVNAAPFGIGLLRSRDAGATWSAPVSITADRDAQLSQPVVGPNGEVHVVWITPFRGGRETIELRSSADGGATFGPVRTVAVVARAIPGDLRGLHAFTLPSAAVDASAGPYRGRIHVAWAEHRGATTDVLATYSADGGATWSSPVRIDDAARGDQFNVWITTDESGAVFACWYDRRHDPANSRYHLYAAASYDGGRTWTPNRRVTDVESAFPSIAWLGEYCGLAARRGAMFPVWTDARNGGNPDVYGARVQTDLEADRATLSASAGGTVSLPIHAGPAHGGRAYFMLASLSGTAPGVAVGCGVRLPLNPDPVLELSLRYASQPPFHDTAGFAGTDGIPPTQPSFRIAPGVLTPLVGAELSFAYLILGGPCLAAYGSNPVTVRIVP